jgi:hypothetical protein
MSLAERIWALLREREQIAARKRRLRDERPA